MSTIPSVNNLSVELKKDTESILSAFSAATPAGNIVSGTRRVEESRREDAEKFRRILANSPHIAWTADENGQTHYISPSIEALIGYTKAEVCADGEFLRSRAHPDDFDRVDRAFRALFEDQVDFDEEFRIQTKDGIWIWIQDRAIRTYVENGLRHADGTLCEVTRRKEAEIELQSKTALLEAQVNSTIDGILVVDGCGQIILRNQRLLELFRLPCDLQAGNDYRVMLDHSIPLMKDPEAFLAKIEYLYRHPMETSRDEIEFKDGATLERYSSPVVGNDGRHYGRIWTFRDITERKRNEDTLRQLSVVVEQSPISVAITNCKGDISYVNRKFTEYTGYTLEEVTGRNSRILNSEYSSPEVYKTLWATILEGKEWRGEFRNKKKNGDLYWEAATITPILDPSGTVTHFLAMTEDITERRILESQLRQAQKLKGIGQLAAGIAHEINTPIQFVTDNLVFLRESWTAAHQLIELYRGVIRDCAESIPPLVMASLDDAEKNCDLEFISSEVPDAVNQGLDGARRVAKIVRAMKDFSHPDSADKVQTDLNEAIESTIAVGRNEWRYVAEMVTYFDDALPPVFCYPGEINQAILNLVVNAAHSIKEKVKEGEMGRITIRTRRCDEFAEITIEDTGNGIPEDIHTRIFEPFFTTKDVGVGTGQGLALAHSVIVKKHHGKIWFETEPGHGTTFLLHLPIRLDDLKKEG